VSLFDEFLDRTCTPPYPEGARTVLRDRCLAGFELASAELLRIQHTFIRLPPTSAHRERLARTTRAPSTVAMAFYDCYIAASVYDDLPSACAKLRAIRNKPVVHKIVPLLFTRRL